MAIGATKSKVGALQLRDEALVRRDDAVDVGRAVRRCGSLFACRSMRFERLAAMMRWLWSTTTISDVSGETLIASTMCCSSLVSSRLSLATLTVSMICTAR